MDPLFVRTKSESHATVSASSSLTDAGAAGSPTGMSPVDDKLANETFVYKLHRYVWRSGAPCSIRR